MVSARAVNLSHLAAERPGHVQVASTYRRLQRFFQHVRLRPDWAAPLVSELAGLRGSNSWYLALDRTQWRIGRHEVNFLVLAAVTRRFRLPLMWTMARGRGNSSTRQRIALDAYAKRWAIECLLGDAKTRGLNIEDTRLTDPDKLALLMGLAAFAIDWAARAAKDRLGTGWPKRKAHGYLAKSWFRTGFDQIRNLLRSDPLQAIAPWSRIAQKKYPNPQSRVV